MTLTGLNRPDPQIVVTLRARSMARLRRSYFSLAAESVTRYRVPFDRVIQHLWHARRSNRRFTVRHVKFPHDLVHTIACVEGINLAWVDLAEQYEPTLIRQCRGTHDEVSAVMLVRRLFVELRRQIREQPASASLTLTDYTGDRPLSAWLADRLNALRTREAIARVHQRPPLMRSLGAAAARSRPDRRNVFLGEHSLPLNLVIHNPADESSVAPTPVRAIASADG